MPMKKRHDLRAELEAQRQEVQAEIEAGVDQDGQFVRHNEEQTLLVQVFESLARAHFHMMRAINHDQELEKWREKGKDPKLAKTRDDQLEVNLNRAREAEELKRVEEKKNAKGEK